MVVRQPSYSWIGVLVILIVIGAVLFGAEFKDSDIVNPISHGVAAEATRTAAAYTSESNRLSHVATETAIAHAAAATGQAATQIARLDDVAYEATANAVALAATADWQRVMATPTSTPALQPTPEPSITTTRAPQVDLFASTVSVVVVAAVVVALLGALAIVYQAVVRERAAAAMAEARRIEQATKRAEAEAHLREREAEVLREQRRNVQMAASAEDNPERRAEMLRSLHSPTGDGNSRKGGAAQSYVDESR